MREEDLYGDVRDEAHRVLVVQEDQVRASVAGRGAELAPELHFGHRRLDLHVPGGDDVRRIGLVGTIRVDDVEAFFGDG